MIFDHINSLSPIERDRLLNRITPKFLPGSILLLTGGPGTGKTIFLQQLLDRIDTKAAHLDVKTLSPDITFFVRNLINAFDMLWPGTLNADEIVPLTATNPLTAIDLALDELLLKASEPAVIALDSCELIAERPTWQAALSVLVSRLPLFISLILSSRLQLHFKNLSSLKLHGRLLTVDKNDLYFDYFETEAFIRRNLPTANNNFIHKIHKETSGWPAGLALVCQDLRKGKSDRFLDSRPSKNLLEYLQHEIFDALSQDAKELLCTAACLQPFNVSLLKTASGSKTKDLLNKILSISPMIESLVSEPEHTSYRFTGLCSQFLLDQAKDVLGIEKVKNLHRVAADYFKENGNIDLALDHYVSMKEWRSASDLILEHHVRWLQDGEYERLTHWINKLPEHILRKKPKILLVLGLANLYLGEIKEAEKNLENAFSNLKKGSKDWSNAGCRLCEAKLLNGHTQQATEIATNVTANSKLLSKYRAEAMLFEAIALHQLCQFNKCGRRWRQINTIANSKLLPLDQTTRCYLTTPKAVFYNLERSEFQESEQILDLAITVFKNSDPLKRLPWALIFKGVLKLELLQHEKALPWFRKAVDIAKNVNRSTHALSTAFMAFILAQLQLREDALRWLEKAKETANQDPTLWAPSLCAIASAILTDNLSTKREAFELAWNIATQRSMLLPQAMTAYSAFAHRKSYEERERIFSFLEKAAETSQKWCVAHREARALLYLYVLDQETRGKGRTKWLMRAFQLIKEKNLTFLLTRDPNINGLSLAKHALDAGVVEDFLWKIWPMWDNEGSEVLIESFYGANPQTKVKIAEIWRKTGFRPAMPILSKAIKAAKSKRIAKKLEKSLQHISNKPPEPLFVQLLGGFALRKGANMVPDDLWKRQTAKSLFKFLCINHAVPFAQEQLADIFWPEVAPSKAKANLWSAISAIRTALEPGISARAKSGYLQVSNKIYKLDLPQGSSIDILEFKKEARSGFHHLEKGDHARASFCFQRAADLYKGELLPEDLYEDWCAEPREHLRLLLIKVLKALATIYFNQRDIEQCISIGHKVIALDTWDEDAYLLIMRCYLLQGLEIKAIATYKKCEKVLAEELEIEPNDELKDLYRRIVQRRKGDFR